MIDESEKRREVIRRLVGWAQGEDKVRAMLLFSSCDDLMTMKQILDYDLRFRDLRRMLKWHMEIEQGWRVKPGAYGKGLKRHIKPEIWAVLERTYTGAGTDKNWRALYQIIDLYRALAVEVGERLGFQYPMGLEERVLAYIGQMRKLDRKASHFEGLVGGK